MLTPGFTATHGATLDEAAKFAGCYSDATATHAGSSDASSFRRQVEGLATGGYAIGVNFHRPSLGQAGGGHFSPSKPRDSNAVPIPTSVLETCLCQ